MPLHRLEQRLCGGFYFGKKKLELIMSVLMILCAFALAERGWQQTLGEHVTGNSGKNVWSLMPDTGEMIQERSGWMIPGKRISIWSFADKVKRILEQQDIDVIMTRETDTGLYEEDASNKKSTGSEKRVSIINENQPDCVISIHQNSYHEGICSWGAGILLWNIRTGKSTGGIDTEKDDRLCGSGESASGKGK